MSEQLTFDWASDPDIQKPPAPQSEKPGKPDKKQNPCIAQYGPGPNGKTCDQCSRLVGICHARTYYKCRLRKVTNGPASDHSRRWQACAKFEQRTDDIPLYDGR
jgi:hypothetical protein